MTTYKELYKTVKSEYELSELVVGENYLIDGLLEFNDSDDDQVLVVNCKNGQIVNGQHYSINPKVLELIVGFNDTSEIDRELDEFKEFIANDYRDLSIEDKYLPEIKLNENQRGFLNSIVDEHSVFGGGYIKGYYRAARGFEENFYDGIDEHQFKDEKYKQSYELKSSYYYNQLNSFEILDVMKKLVAMEDERLSMIYI